MRVRETNLKNLDSILLYHRVRSLCFMLISVEEPKKKTDLFHSFQQIEAYYLFLLLSVSCCSTTNYRLLPLQRHLHAINAPQFALPPTPLSLFLSFSERFCSQDSLLSLIISANAVQGSYCFLKLIKNPKSPFIFVSFVFQISFDQVGQSSRFFSDPS